MKKALIVIDVQKYFLNKNSKKFVLRIRDYLKQHFSDYSQVYFTIFKNDSTSSLWKISEWRDLTGPPETEICDEIKEFTNDKNMHYKNILSAFKVPAIKKSIRDNKISEVHLCGFDTDCCVLATTYDLFDQGIKPVLLENLTWSTSKDNLHESAIQMIERNVGFVNKVRL